MLKKSLIVVGTPASSVGKHRLKNGVIAFIALRLNKQTTFVTKKAKKFFFAFLLA